MDDAHRLCACFFVSQNDGGYNWEVCACSSVTSGSTSRRMYCARLQNVNMSSPLVRRAIRGCGAARRAGFGLVSCRGGCLAPLPVGLPRVGGDGEETRRQTGSRGRARGCRWSWGEACFESALRCEMPKTRECAQAMRSSRRFNPLRPRRRDGLETLATTKRGISPRP